MKKIVLLLLAVFAVTLGAQAQKLSKEEKAAQKAQKEAETAALIKDLFTSQNMVFVPTDYETKTGGSSNINNYQYLRIRPNSLQSDLSYKDGNLKISISSQSALSVVTNEATKNGHILVMKFDHNGATYTIELAANSKTGMAVLKVKSNKTEDYIYRGSIKEN